MSKTDNFIIILNWNEPEMTIKCLEKLLIYESINTILIVDNGSEDNKRKKLKRFLDDNMFIDLEQNNNEIYRERNKYKRLYLLLKENYGYAVGNNKALIKIKNMNPHNVIIMNNDIILNSNISKGLFEKIDNDKNIAFVGPKVILPSGDDSNPILKKDNFYYLFLFKIFYPILIPFKCFIENIDYNFSRYLNNNEMLSGCIFAVNFDKFEMINFFDKNTFLGSEELIINEKIKKYNLKNYYLSEQKVLHINSHSTRKVNKKKLMNNTFNAKKYYLKTYKKEKNFTIFLYYIANQIMNNIWIPIKRFIRKRR